MPQKPLLAAALLLASIARTMAQESSTAANPLNEVISVAQSAAGAINSVNAQQTPASSSSASSSTSPTPAATSSSPAAAAPHSGVNRTTLIVAVVCAVVGALLIALLLGLGCWCLARRRRRRRSQAHALIDDEVKTWRSNEPKNPGRDYSPHRNSRITTSMEQQPMIPPAAKAPDMQQHPALRNNNADNPFVPVPPSPRRQAPNARAGLTDASIPGAAPFITPEAPKSRSRSRSSSQPQTASNPKALPTANTNSRPSTPFGLSGIGQPYEDMHVHILQNDSPSHELRQSLNNREPIQPNPPVEPIHRFDTPPGGVPKASNRHSAASVTNNRHTTSDTSSTEEGSTSADDWRYNKSANFAHVPPWEQRQHRYSNSPASSAAQTFHIPTPPIPWEERQSRYGSPAHSPRHSRDLQNPSGTTTTTGAANANGTTSGYVDGGARRKNSRSPATSINGQPRRLRFSDLQADDIGYNNNHRHSQGVGEAL
ncbi:MAG: hypothetical protein Q9177_001926 [Variospora cf. flavescens]